MDPNSAEQVFRVVCFVVNFELVVAVVINFLGYRIEPPAEFVSNTMIVESGFRPVRHPTRLSSAGVNRLDKVPNQI